MSYKPGQIIVRVALELGPFDTPTEPDWTDLTDRVKSYRDERGRRDVLQDFGPGTATVVLNNHDRMLDPSNPDGLLFNGADPIGLPLCPVQIGQMWGGVEYPKFHGVLGPEAWPGDIATKGESGTVTLHVMDALGHSPGLPGDIFGIITKSLVPDWWSRMDDFEFPVLDDGSPVPNSIGAGSGTVEGTTGISRPYVRTGGLSGLGVNDPGLLLSGDHIVRFAAADVMPNGDEDKYTVEMWWASRNAVPSGQISRVAEMVHPISGIRRWSIYVDGDDGLAYVTTFDAAGDPVDTDTITPVASSRWDEGDTHFVVAVWDHGVPNNLTVWFGGVSVTLSIPGDLYESDLVIGPSPVDTLFDEVVIWRRVLDYTTEIVPALLTFGVGSMWSGDTWLDRLGHWIEATGRTVTSDDTEAMDFTDSTLGLWGLLHPDVPTFENPAGNYTITLPDTLADAYLVTVDSCDGARWATKLNVLRARSRSALYDPAFAADYATPVLFTDANTTLGTDEYRHAGVEVTGLRIDRVINDASVTYLYSPDGPPDITTAAPMTNRAIDEASRDRYGLRAWTRKTEWCDWPLNQETANLIVERFAQPRQEIENIHLDPTGTGDDALALAEWLITTCELEQACEVTYTPAGGDPVNIPDLNIQHIAWDWTPERWSVDIVAAAS